MALFEIYERAHQGVAKSESFLHFDPLNEWRGGGGLKCFPKSGMDGTTKASRGDSFDHLIARMSQFKASLPIM